MFNTFISYRRKDGEDVAGRVYEYLENRKYDPFFDRTGLNKGRFDEQLRINIINCQNFILILSKEAFDRINEPDDWVKKEIELAIKYNLNIIPLTEKGFTFPKILPKEIEKIKLYQQIEFTRSDIFSALKNIENKLAQRIEEFNMFDPLAGKRIDISGDYITTYEDSDNGKIVYKKAPAKLKNFGKYIKGTTKFGDKQIWKMRGSIDKNKRIVGKYWATGEIDNGMGTFYLQPTSPSILEGFWCGYDNENKQISSGRYIFRKIYKDYSIVNLQKNHFPYLINIANKGLGDNYLSLDYFDKCFKKTDGYMCKVAIDNRNNKPFGFCIYKIID